MFDDWSPVSSGASSPLRQPPPRGQCSLLLIHCSCLLYCRTHHMFTSYSPAILLLLVVSFSTKHELIGCRSCSSFVQARAAQLENKMTRDVVGQLLESRPSKVRRCFVAASAAASVAHLGLDEHACVRACVRAFCPPVFSHSHSLVACVAVVITVLSPSCAVFLPRPFSRTS